MRVRWRHGWCKGKPICGPSFQVELLLLLPAVHRCVVADLLMVLDVSSALFATKYYFFPRKTKT